MEHESNPIRDTVFANVQQYGWHHWRVYAGPTPPWSYSVGLHKTADAPELVLAGAAIYSNTDVAEGFAAVAERSRIEKPDAESVWHAPILGTVGFRDVHESWTVELMLGDLDFYGGSPFPALQVVPAEADTIDTPDMSRPLEAALPGPWQWLKMPWPFEIAKDTQVITDTLALRGHPVTLVNRNKDASGTEWDAWATEEINVPAEIMRITAFGTLLAADDTVAETLGLEPGQYAARDFIGDPWRIWVE